MRFVYSFEGKTYEVPQHFVYKVHKGGFDIVESFFTWAFNKHNISITDIELIHTNENRLSKDDTKGVTAASVMYVAIVKGKSSKGVVKVGDGEVSNESITNYQRAYPAGLAIKRAKVNMGKEFLNLVDLKMSENPKDFIVKFGEDNGLTMETVANQPNGMSKIEFFAHQYEGDSLLKYKAQQFLELYAGGAHAKKPFDVVPDERSSFQPATPSQNLQNQQPMNQQPMNQQPMNQQPMNQQPMNQQPMNQQPVNQQPMNQQPMNQQPMNQQPTNQQEFHPENKQPNMFTNQGGYPPPPT